jgi:hypothetical protein
MSSGLTPVARIGQQVPGPNTAELNDAVPGSPCAFRSDGGFALEVAPAQEVGCLHKKPEE